MELILMLFLHLIDDYKLQGILAEMKQKSWWDERTKDKKYRYDYLVALYEHAFMNSVMIHIPVYLFMSRNIVFLTCTIIMCTALHAFCDGLKANFKIINLLQDQLFHIITIIILYLIYRFNILHIIFPYI